MVLTKTQFILKTGLQERIGKKKSVFFFNWYAYGTLKTNKKREDVLVTVHFKNWIH